jgi:hypothetical protein
MQNTARAAVLLLVCALAVPAVRATTVIEQTTSQMAQQANVVITGHCVNSQSQWVGKSLVTLATIQVDDVLKGQPGTQVTVVLPGGADLKRKIPVAMSYPAAPQIGSQEQVLLFLTAQSVVPNGYSVVGYSQGKFTIQTNSQGQQVVAQDLGGLTLVQPLKSVSGQSQALAESPSRPGAAKAVALDVMKQQIRDALTAGTSR